MILALVVTIWYMIHVNADLGNLYIPVFVTALLIFFNLQLLGGTTFSIEKDKFRIEDVGFGVLWYAIYITLLTLSLWLIGGIAQFSMEAALEFQQSYITLFTQNIWFNLTGFILIVAAAETLVLVGIYMSLKKFPMFQNAERFDWQHLLLTSILALGFALFHLKVSSVIQGEMFTFDYIALYAHFLFAVVTLMGLSFRKIKEISPAFYMHAISLIIALAIKYKWIMV